MPHDLPLYSSPVLGWFVTLGNLAIWLGLASAITCVVLYWTAMIRTMRHGAAPAAEEAAAGKKARQPETSPEQQKTDAIGRWARRFFFITSFFVVLGSVSLMTLILTQQYTVAYVQKNSNEHLPLGFRFASFWGDQEGTFFLWAVYNVILGSVLLWRARADERWVMPFFALIHVSLFTLLTFMNPFEVVGSQDVRQLLTSPMAVQAGITPEMLSFLPQTLSQHLAWFFGWGKYWHITEGRGLNESLQNFWFVIHPPTLFLGYSSMIVPACFALAALMKRDYDSWVTRATPWLMFSWTVLGTGIFLGAYWAYETLGWGGYWSWDEVENSSLLPWLVGTALLHGLLAQRNRGNFKQANLFLGVIAGSAVLLGSFLVRSGVLQGSVHSFATPQKSVFITLLAILVIWFAMSVAIWLWRFKDIQSEIAYEDTWERHFGFFLGLIVLSASALVVCFGVTAFIWTPILLKHSQRMEFSWYNKVLLPTAFVMVLLMAITPLMPWKRARDDGQPRPIRPENKIFLGIAGAITIFFIFSAFWAWKGGFQTQNDPAYLSFALVMALALVTNVMCLARAAKGGVLNIGPWLAHIGFALTMAGVVVTSRFNSVHPIQDQEVNQVARVIGRDFTFMGGRPATDPSDRDHMVIRMKNPDGKTYEFAPKAYLHQGDDGQVQAMATPVIHHEWWGPAFGDIYVEPSSAVYPGGAALFEDVKRGDAAPVMTKVQLHPDSPEDTVGIQLLNFDMHEVQNMKPGSSKPPTMYLDCLLTVNGRQKKVRLAAMVTGEGVQGTPVPVEGLRQGTGYTLVFQGLKPGAMTASFALQPEVNVPHGSYQVLHVPGIQILWLGCYVMFTGGWLSFLRRRQLAGRPVPVREVERVRAPRPARPTTREAEPAGAE